MVKISIIRCEYCQCNIDTDFDAEHFGTESDARCIIEEQDKEPMRLQKEYCESKDIPMFAPSSGSCFFCNKKIQDTGLKHITGCEHCHRSFCE